MREKETMALLPENYYLLTPFTEEDHINQVIFQEKVPLYIKKNSTLRQTEAHPVTKSEIYFGLSQILDNPEDWETVLKGHFLQRILTFDNEKYIISTQGYAGNDGTLVITIQRIHTK